MTHFGAQRLHVGGQTWIWLRLLGLRESRLSSEVGLLQGAGQKAAPGARYRSKAALAGAVHLKRHLASLADGEGSICQPRS